MNEGRLAQSRLVPAVLAACVFGSTALHTAPAIAKEQGAGQILIKNVRIFDGTAAKLAAATDVLIVGNKIENEIKWMDRLSEWYSPAELLIMATGNAGELLKLSGIRDPYPGELGVVKEGALADLLLVDGNPLDDIKVVGELDNLRVIIKDGHVVKNTL